MAGEGATAQLRDVELDQLATSLLASEIPYQAIFEESMPKLLRYMSKADLRDACAKLQLKTAGDLADILDRSPRTIQYWLSDESVQEIPVSDAALVRLLIAGRVKRSELGRPSRDD